MTLKYLGTTRTPSIELPLDRIGPPGISSELHALPQLENDFRSNDERLNDLSIRRFKVSACLSKLPPNENIISSRFSEKDGNSYLLMPSNASFIIVATPLVVRTEQMIPIFSFSSTQRRPPWVPAFAGMTEKDWVPNVKIIPLVVQIKQMIPVLSSSSPRAQKRGSMTAGLVTAALFHTNERRGVVGIKC